jgi:hypothetical protein
MGRGISMIMRMQEMMIDRSMKRAYTYISIWHSITYKEIPLSSLSTTNYLSSPFFAYPTIQKQIPGNSLIKHNKMSHIKK